MGYYSIIVSIHTAEVLARVRYELLVLAVGSRIWGISVFPMSELIQISVFRNLL
jgi:hypothetical protein